jgi:DNA-binding beta-propeller fold protein YncE
MSCTIGSTKSVLIAIAVSCLLLCCNGVNAQPVGGYRLDEAVTLPSTNTSWDYIELDQARSYLFVARRNDGLTIYDVRKKKLVANVGGTVGANGVLLLPAVDRILIANTDGTVTVIAYKSLKVVDRVKVDNASLNAGFVEPMSGKVFLVTATREKVSTLFQVDPQTGATLAKFDFATTKIDTPAVDGKGTIFVPMRYQNQIARVSVSDMKASAVWPTGDCVNPVAMEYDKAHNRLLVACRGEKPVFIAMDASTGKIVSTLPIGRGVDGLVVDHENRMIVTSNGADANLVVIRHHSADEYKIVEVVATRPMARTMAMDQSSKRLFLVTAEHTTGMTGADGKPLPPHFHTNTFSILSYAKTQ